MNFVRFVVAVATVALPAISSHAADFESFTVFENGTEGYNAFRIPAIVKATNGDLLAFCEAREGGDASAIDLVMKRSTDDGATWQALQVVQENDDFRELFSDDAPPITVGNPSPVVDGLDPDHPGRIWLPFTLENDRVFVTFSDDHGATWSVRREITPDVKKDSWGWYATGPVHSIQLQHGEHRGRLVVPCDHRLGDDGADRGPNGAHAILSDDHGKTWRLGAVDDTYDDGLNANETTVVELNDGRLYFNTRDQNGNAPGTRGGAFSSDGGESFDASGDATYRWFVPEGEPFDPPVVQCCLLRAASTVDGDSRNLILFSGPDENGPTGKGRSDLRLRYSTDEASTWHDGPLIHEGPAAYSDMVRLEPVQFGILFEAGPKGSEGYTQIRFARFDTDDVVVAAADAGRRSPEWIWTDGDRSAAGQSVTFSRSFELAAPVAQASLQFAADFCRCEVWLNGKLRAAVDDFSSWPTVDVTEDLRIGRNTITLNGVSGEGPSAIAFRLNVTLADGSEVIVESSPSDAGTVSFGRVLPELWNPAARVSSFDDYTQWEQAINAPAETDPAAFATQPGFQIQLLRSAGRDEGSWISMAFDPRGRLTVSREDQGLLRMTLAADRSNVERVETINDSLLECRGLLYAYGSLYANANNSKGLYRLTDTDGDDQFDDVKLLREFPGGVGHGRNDLALGPDGMIYSIHGDSVDVPRENILDRTSPLRADRIDQESIEGHVIRTDRNGERWELVATGLRNPYGIDFNADGELFTYDADAEFDMGAPWYRPTRIDHLVSGADFGWRGRTGKWPPYDADHADNSLPVADVGKGSPTSVVSGRHGKFPAPWNDAMFALDWAYGRILACHLQPRGAGYICRAETFVQGRPFNVTDLAFGPDGAMYVITGGRKTQSALYRIQFTGPKEQPADVTRQQSERSQYSKQQRTVAAQLAKFHGRKDPLAIKTAWPYLGTSDPTLRHAAQVAIEHQPESEWFQPAFDEQRPDLAATTLMMLARVGERGMKAPILHRLSTIPPHSLSTYQQLSLLYAHALCLNNAPVDATIHKRVSDHLLTWFPAPSKAQGPSGAGNGAADSVNRLLAELLVLRLESPAAVSPAVDLLRSAVAQEDRLFYLFVLRHSKAGWTIDQRRMYFEVLGELDRSAFSGEGMPGFLRQIRDEATASLNDAERESLGDLLQPGSQIKPAALTINRPFVREWTVDALTQEIAGSSDPASPERGRQLFGEALCSACHRMHGSGAVVGPDLTWVANRFGRRDLLTSIVSPSSVVAEKYRNMQVIMTDGKVITGRVITGGDYRSKTLRIATDPLRPSQVVEIAKAEIESYEPSPTSPMPEGLLNTLSAEDVMALLAFLESAGR